MRKKLLFLLCVLCASIRVFGAGWTPTDAGLVVNFEPGDQFLLSVDIDGTEYFVCDYSGYTGGRFSYKSGDFLKLIPQATGATVPSDASIWTVDTAVTRVIDLGKGKGKLNYALGGIAYTMWGNNKNTVKAESDHWKFYGGLTSNQSNTDLSDVVFVVPTVRAETDMDPGRTLDLTGKKRGTGDQSWAFDGEMKSGFAGMMYREVYMFQIPRRNEPIVYTNAALVTFNTTTKDTTYAGGGYFVGKGRAGWAYADTKYNKTTRTLFRLYVLNKPFSSCDSYFWGYDTQDYLKYRTGKKGVEMNMKDSTGYKKIYTLDHFYCMERESNESAIYRSGWLNVPTSDSAYFYVGKHDEYYATKDLGSTPGAYSQFRTIKKLPVKALAEAGDTLAPAAGAYGRMVIDTTSGRENLGVTFEPKGYFFQTSSGMNVQMRQVDDSTWMTEQMWYIVDAYMELKGKVLLYTGSQFSTTDRGAEITGWSEWVDAKAIPVVGSDTATAAGKSGWARIHTNRREANGGIEFVLASFDRHLHYSNNDRVGTQIPDQYPLAGETTVKVLEPRLKEGFIFDHWDTEPDGTGTRYLPGDEITLTAEADTLYAIAAFNTTYNVALSFVHPTNGKRYFLNHPGAAAPRYARARHYDDWTNVWQGMANADNNDPNYVSTFRAIGHHSTPITCAECSDEEFVLDPRRDTLRGYEDSLILYEYFSPEREEYLGLYYADPNTIVANNTWAGLFKSTVGWPDYRQPAVDSTKLYSDTYLKRDPEDGNKIKKWDRPNADKSYIRYMEGTNQFDGKATPAEGTTFQISNITMVDGFYVLLPDTVTEPWTDEIVFEYHEDENIRQQVWSKLIGKQLMACMMVGRDTAYYHPNRDKILTTANELRLSPDFRLSQSFSYIRDSRVESLNLVPKENKPTMDLTENDFTCFITSGASSPMDLRYNGEPIDIVDTLRIRLTQGGIGRIKRYYGRWSNKADGLTIAGNTRYRDILVRTKTYHIGDEETRLILKPESESYSFGPLAGQSRELTFMLLKQRVKKLHDITYSVVQEEVLSTDTISNQLSLGPGACSFTSGNPGRYFSVSSAVGRRIVLSTLESNTAEVDHDTLIVSTSVTVDGKSYALTDSVPLMQTTLTDEELVWSAVHNGQRYFIMAGQDAEGDGRLIYRTYTRRNSILYQENTYTQLIKGAENARNNNARYITPWTYRMKAGNQISLKTLDGVNMHFNINGTPGAHATDSVLLTYEYAGVNTNDNANYEELVYLQYATQWLKFNGTSLELVDEKEKATLFSWGYLKREYNLLNEGTYPSLESAEFGYNDPSPVAIKTRYKAYREYTMLLDNQLTYLCREEERTIANLEDENGEWLIASDISLVSDSRFPEGQSGLAKSVDKAGMTTTVTPSPFSPLNKTLEGRYADIVDTLQVTLSRQNGAPGYGFRGDWSKFNSIADACLKIPLVRKTYHAEPFDSLVCRVDNDEYNYAFPPTLTPKDSTHTFYLRTMHRAGTHVLDVNNHTVASTANEGDSTHLMRLNNPELAEIRLVDEYGNTPSWCEISALDTNTVTVKCKQNGIRSPRSAYLYFAYIVTVKSTITGETGMRFVNFRLTVSQASLFQYANNQRLVHTKGASGDPMRDGVQQVHKNTRVLYYYNPAPYKEYDQEVELPVRERAFYGWWRWYREGFDEDSVDVSDTDVPDSLWLTPPRNVGSYNYPFRTIGDSVPVYNSGGDSIGRRLLTMGRYTVFHYPARAYNSKQDAPSKTPRVAPPVNKKTLTYAVDLSNYYDNLPLSMAHVNQIDTAVLDTMLQILEPTLSLRELFVLRPWTEMADTLEHYKYAEGASWESQKFMEDHVVRAPLGNRLLLTTEQRYNYDNLKNHSHSESLLGYYMYDDNWSEWAGDALRQDTMVWCAGWDVPCMWFVYKKGSGYSPCSHRVTESDDFLDVPAKSSITAGQEYDTVYYCLRSPSMRTVFGGETPKGLSVKGNNWFNICRYTIIYHRPAKYGPLVETNGKALITNDEIEQHYEVLERLNFDYNEPGSDYQVYPHPLQWEDASYGYSYPVSPDIPDNRYHNDFAPNFPGSGEYGLVNRIPYSTYWHKMEQHGGAKNGYMIYCDGMSSAGQVAALTLSTELCEGQKMYFSGFVGNPSNQSGKSNPNFIFSVQGREDREGAEWKDITSYMTGDITPSDKWSQIFFPIDYNRKDHDFTHFRVRIYNVASDFDGNDFIIDDMCLFATKPQLISYQANTTCSEQGQSDSLTHVIVRIDYQGFNSEQFNDTSMYYTIEQKNTKREVSFVKLEDAYLNEQTVTGTPDTIYGRIPMPKQDYEPQDPDSVFANITDLVHRFDTTGTGGRRLFNQGYIYEEVDNNIRPVMYIIHKAKLSPVDTFTVRMAPNYRELNNSICAMTSNLKVSNRMLLELNGQEFPEKEVTGLCVNSTYTISLRVKGSLFLDSVAPISLNGSCMNDWLLYGDTTEATSLTRYGYRYSDIRKVITEALRCEPMSGTNVNQFAPNLSSVNRNVLRGYAKTLDLTPGVDAYTLLADLVNNGFLTLYKSSVTSTVASGDSLQYIIMPIIGTGIDKVFQTNVEVCPTPLFVKLKPESGGEVPIMIGGLRREAAQASQPIVVLADEQSANEQIAIRLDSLSRNLVLDSITLISTNDPEFREGIHSLNLVPDRLYNFNGSNDGYYTKGDTILLSPENSGTYHMRPGFSYTFLITLQTNVGDKMIGSCRVGSAPFTLSVVPGYLRWDPKTAESNQWNNPDNWIGITQANLPIHEDAHFVPLPTTSVIIPPLEAGLPWPVLDDPDHIDSVQQVGFSYNTCDAIRFVYGTAMAQQQWLNYNQAVVDMTTPHEKWALRSAPVKGMLSGDVFISNADVNWGTSPWEVGSFDANGRSVNTGNASFWLSVYSRSTTYRGNGNDVADSTRECTTAEWSKISNGMTLSLPPAQGWAVYTRTKSGNDAAVRLPKNDDIYYYYYSNGNINLDVYEHDLRATRNTNAGGHAGELAYHPTGANETYELVQDATATSFVFGNPTMGYIDIWGFITDNGLDGEFRYINANGTWEAVTKTYAEDNTRDTITTRERYLPPMHAMVVTAAAGTSLSVRLDTNRVVTDARQAHPAPSPSPAKRYANAEGKLSKGIMTVTATNAASSRCTTRLQLGQGFHNAIREGEDAMLTTVNIDKYSTTSAPATPFNIYAAEGGYGLSIDLRDSIVNVPISFYMSALPFDPVTRLWFTGVNAIDGPLVLYDAQTDTERDIADGICLEIETPEESHRTRYFIRRKGFKPTDDGQPIATGVTPFDTDDEQAVKVIRNGHVLIIRGGHVYTMYGQKIR